MTIIRSDQYATACSSHGEPEIRDPDSMTRIRIGEFGSSDEAYEGLDGKAASHKPKEDCPDPIRSMKKPYKAASARSKRQRRQPKFYHLELNKSPEKRSIDLKTPYKGIRKRPSGKFDAYIWDPISRTSCYIGLFGSAKAAHAAYCAKKLKIDEKILKNGNRFKRVKHLKSGLWAARILDPTKGLIHLGKFRSEEEAFRAHHRKKLQIEEKGKVERGRGSKRPNPESRGFGSATSLLGPESGRVTFESAEVTSEAYCARKQEIERKKAASVEEEQELGKTRDGSGSPYDGVRDKTPSYDCWQKLEIEEPQEAASVGSQCSQFSWTWKDIEGKADSVPLIVDENGFLLGEFSQIDDLAICEADDCY